MHRASMVDDNAEAFRRGWQIFLGKAGVNRQMLEIIVGGGQQETFALFNNQLNRHVQQEATVPKPLMLVDSEEPVAAGRAVWQHLGMRRQHSFQRPSDADDHSAFMMVQAMETWFIADQPALQRFFGSSFDASAFNNLPALESILKGDTLNQLRQATRRCSRHYRKGKRASDLLAEINPERVAAACPHANQLIVHLRTL